MDKTQAPAVLEREITVAAVQTAVSYTHLRVTDRSCCWRR